MEIKTNKKEVTQSEKIKTLELAAQKANIKDFNDLPELVPVVYNPKEPSKPLFFAGTINAVTGRGGSRKTTFLTVLAAQTSKEGRVLWVDTEQSKSEIKTVYLKIKEQGGNMENIDFYAFLDVENVDFLELFKHVIQQKNPEFIVLDNITDFNDNAILDINAAVNLTRIMSKIAKAKNAAICAVIHENESGTETRGRGHIGSEFVRKCSTVLSVSKPDVEDFHRTAVTFRKSRNYKGRDFDFMVNKDNTPTILQRTDNQENNANNVYLF